MLVRRQQKRKTQTEANLLGQESQLYEEQATAQMNEACSENLKARQPEYHQQLVHFANVGYVYFKQQVIHVLSILRIYLVRVVYDKHFI